MENYSFNAQVSKVLKLMIHSVYTNRDIFLRELISNASDACDKLRYLVLTNPKLQNEALDFGIDITVDKDAGILTISDNGIGMSREELIEHLGTIAKSGTQEFASQLKDGAPEQIGQFGVGFYSAFMVASRVRVVSRKAGETAAHVWESTGEGEFSVGEITEEAPRGTRVELQLQDDAKAYLDHFKLKHIVQTYSDHIAFPVRVAGEVVSSGQALWTRPKGEITKEQYQEFYRHVAHQPDDPWLTLHNTVEGKLSYTNLLFIPSLKPFDLFHPERKRRVKLYVKRVFITDEGVDLIPPYLRFLRGVVDSQDVPLNISRETLQANPIVAQIRESLAKKVLSELAKKMSDVESYTGFFANYGATIKEGLCEANTPHAQILDICQFYSTHSDAPTTLAEYITRAGEAAQPIYYLSGDSLEQLRADPRLAGFKAKGIEVLLFKDHVDDFWVTVTREYKGREFTSITRADAAPAEEPKAESEKLSESIILARFKTHLGARVADVRATTKLTDIPATLAVPAGGMDVRLERFLIEQKQLPAASAKILELNLNHPLITETTSPELIEIIFNQAKLIDGEALDNPAEFIRAINQQLTTAA